MNATAKWLLCISLFLIFSLLSIGYASLSGNVSLSGQVSTEPPPYKGVYISDVKVLSASGVTENAFQYIHPTNLANAVGVSSQNASVTYEITVHNNTDMSYWYLGTNILASHGDNALIGTNGGIHITTKDNSSASSTLFDTGDWVPAQTYRTFYATYTFGANARGQRELLVNFEFGLHMASVQDGFLKVLNDKVTENGYYYLSGVFDEKNAENGSTILANIGAEQDVFNRLFGGNLTVNFDGEERPVTILVERRNVDGKTASGDTYADGAPTGCEYTLYLSVDDLSAPGGRATVYAVSYSCGADGVWYQIGELYEGTSVRQDYYPSTEHYDGAYDVSTWLATKKDYQVTADITYKVGYEQGTNFDKMNTIDELMSVNDQEFYNKVNNNSGKLLKPVCLILYRYQHNNGRYDEYINEQNHLKPGYSALRQAFDKIKPYCLIANGAQEVKIQNANSLSRAILIQLLEEIQLTYDYYLAVNPN